MVEVTYSGADMYVPLEREIVEDVADYVQLNSVTVPLWKSRQLTYWTTLCIWISATFNNKSVIFYTKI